MNKISLIILSVCYLLFTSCAPCDGPPPDRESRHHHSDGPNEDRMQWDGDHQPHDRGDDHRYEERNNDHRKQRDDLDKRAPQSSYRGDGRSEAAQE